jgi:hypothetical protein
VNYAEPLQASGNSSTTVAPAVTAFIPEEDMYVPSHGILADLHDANRVGKHAVPERVGSKGKGRTKAVERLSKSVKGVPIAGGSVVEIKCWRGAGHGDGCMVRRYREDVAAWCGREVVQQPS